MKDFFFFLIADSGVQTEEIFLKGEKPFKEPVKIHTMFGGWPRKKYICWMAWRHLTLTMHKADLNVLRASFGFTTRARHSSMSNLAKACLKTKTDRHVVEHTVREKRKIQKPKCAYGQLLTLLHFLKPLGENKGPSARIWPGASIVLHTSIVRKHQEICFRTPLSDGPPKMGSPGEHSLQDTKVFQVRR